MNEVFLLVTVSAFALLLMVGAIILHRLWRQHSKLKQEVEHLTLQLQGGLKDVAGLCSAAVAVDRRLAANENGVSSLLNALNRQPPEATQPPVFEEAVQENASQGYEHAIQQIRDGANVDDLVKHCGLTRDEAMLLMRLHGKPRR